MNSYCYKCGENHTQKVTLSEKLKKLGLKHYPSKFLTHCIPCEYVVATKDYFFYCHSENIDANMLGSGETFECETEADLLKAITLLK